MRRISIGLAAALATGANAHFQLQYPPPRGPFVFYLEPTFCDGYTNVTTNRTVFPLSNGVINLASEHPSWTAGVIISTVPDPSSFADFNSSSGYQLVVPYFQTSGEGKFCFPINLATSGVPGVQDGANVTIQVIYDGGDGTLFQCADLTLSATATVPGNASTTCSNVTASTAASYPTASKAASSSMGSASTAASSPTASAGTASSAAGKIVVGISGIAVAALAGLALFL